LPNAYKSPSAPGWACGPVAHWRRRRRIDGIRSLGKISDDYGVNDIADPLGESWFVVETSLD